MWKNRSICYALSVEDGRLRALKGRRAAGRIRMDTLAEGVPADGPAAMSILQQVEADVMTGRAVSAAALPAHETVIHRLTAPFPSIRKARKVFPSLLDLALPFPVEQCECRFEQIRMVAGGKVETLAIAARRESISTCIDELAGRKLRPVILDAEPRAVWSELAQRFPPADPASRLVVHREGSRVLILYGEGDRFLSGTSVRSWISTEDLSRRMARFLRSVIPSGGSPAELIWSGHPALASSDKEEILRSCSIQPAAMHDAGGEDILLQGLCRNALQEPGAIVNLRAVGAAHPAWDSLTSRPLQKAWLTCGMAAALVIGVNIAWTRLQDHRAEQLTREAQATAASITGRERIPRGQEAFITTRFMNEAREQYEPFLQFTRPGMNTRFYQLLNEAHERGIALTHLNLMDGGSVIRGNAPSAGEAEAFRDALSAVGIEMKISIEPAGAGDGVRFRLEDRT